MSVLPCLSFCFGSAMMLASQRLPRWLGPPVTSRIRFQSTQPIDQWRRSWRISIPRCSARCHHSSAFMCLYTTPGQLHASVAKMNLSGAISCVLSRLCVFRPPYQCTPIPSIIERAPGSAYRVLAHSTTEREEGIANRTRPSHVMSDTRMGWGQGRGWARTWTRMGEAVGWRRRVPRQQHGTGRDTHAYRDPCCGQIR